MAAIRKYQRIRVWGNINCSSTGHYGARIAYSVMNKDGSVHNRKRAWFYIGTASTLPKYAQDEIFHQLRDLYRDGGLHIYENDQDGNARWENLRYHEPAHFEYMIDYVQEGAK